LYCDLVCGGRRGPDYVIFIEISAARPLKRGVERRMQRQRAPRSQSDILLVSHGR
jgi:hypothetical protein